MILLSSAAAWLATAARTLAVTALVLLASGVARGTPAAAQEAGSLFATAAEGSQIKVDHSIWTGLLAKYVKRNSDGLNEVDYAAFRAADLAPLRQYLCFARRASIRRPSTGPSSSPSLRICTTPRRSRSCSTTIPSPRSRTSRSVERFFPIVTGGPWKKKVVELSGTPLSLDDIEHGLLRPIFQDPRTHYALNCALDRLPEPPHGSFHRRETGRTAQRSGA